MTEMSQYQNFLIPNPFSTDKLQLILRIFSPSEFVFIEIVLSHMHMLYSLVR